jgi:hypothetical protein
LTSSPVSMHATLDGWDRHDNNSNSNVAPANMVPMSIPDSLIHPVRHSQALVLHFAKLTRSTRLYTTSHNHGPCHNI